MCHRGRPLTRRRPVVETGSRRGTAADQPPAVGCTWHYYGSFIDEKTVIDNAEFGDAPGAPIGIDVVVVAGKVMVADGAIGEERPGRVLRRG